MRPIHLILCGILALGTSACVSDPARDAAAEEGAVASVVALLSGYESGGVVSLMSDLPIDSLAEDTEPPFAMHASHRQSPDDVRMLVSNRGAGGSLGQVRMRYAVHAPQAGEPGSGPTVALDIDEESTHASGSMAIRAMSLGTIRIESAGPLRTLSSSGDLRIGGDLGDRPTDGVPFTHVDATLSWTHVRIGAAAAGARPLTGEIAISVAASGAGGLVLRNATLTLDGTDRGMLDVGGRRFRVDLRRGTTE